MKSLRRLAICAAAVACIGLAAPLAAFAEETAPAGSKAESRKEKQQDMIHSQKMTLQDLKGHCKELDTVSYNTGAILTRRAMETEQLPEHSTTHHKSQKERNEEIL